MSAYSTSTSEYPQRSGSEVSESSNAAILASLRTSLLAHIPSPSPSPNGSQVAFSLVLGAGVVADAEEFRTFRALGEGKDCTRGLSGISPMIFTTQPRFLEHHSAVGPT